jgi:hypothetical protein
VLPARLMVYYALAMVLFMDCGYQEVWNKLVAGLSGAKFYRQRREVDLQPSTAAIARVGQVRVVAPGDRGGSRCGAREADEDPHGG